MAHNEWKRVSEQAEKAILFIHGIVGSPDHFIRFVELVPQNISVYNILLDGHGKGPKEFSRSSMKKWELQVQKAVDELAATHQEICVVAHSMGTLLAIEQGYKCPKVSKLFLLAVPIQVFVKPEMLPLSAKIFFDCVRESDVRGIAAQACYGIQPDKNLLHYVGWVPRYLELFRKIRETRRNLHRLDVPCRAYQSIEDELVSKSSAKYLRNHSAMEVFELKHSGHFYYDQPDFNSLQADFMNFIVQ